MMKKVISILAVIAFLLGFVGCDKIQDVEDPVKEIATPSNFQIKQNENTLVLQWDAVDGATDYLLSKNGVYWLSTTKTTIVDDKPQKGLNTYELIACNGTQQSKPTTASFEYVPKNEEEPTADWYIKHPWGDGSDESWSWQPMEKQTDGKYIYIGQWGGIGANINSIANDNGAKWFPKSSIEGASNISIGEEITFVYEVASNTLYIEGKSDVTYYYIKHPWGSGTDASWAWKQMYPQGNGIYTYNGKWGGTGVNINTIPDDDGAYWFPIQANAFSIGTMTKFIYNANTNSITVEQTTEEEGGGGGGAVTMVAPANLSLSYNAYMDKQYITCSWNNVKDATGYKLYRSVGNNSNMTLIYEGNLSIYYDYAIDYGKTYYYQVSGVFGSHGEGPKSQIQSIVASSNSTF